ncbi:helix-turn-helix domain-containing protein [Solilutibacter silvestris]|uniref:Cro/C1-type HTH DNA-binding domain n=1 Tax=Solilutibacter silvestris TaxID=1645665 RepID=A0A2K1Q1F2_9GAMM|nr:helix-turn-helix transcriptional regulator [Lysobacter silvestris]PNS08870.1 Cro/C1-type HTH DNA-binding domain [Lysobacter silvestris]
MSPARASVQWSLRNLLEQNAQFTIAELVRQIELDGDYPQTRKQVTRLLGQSPETVPILLIGSLCRILKCTPNDLFGWTPPDNVVDLNPGMTAFTAEARKRAVAGGVSDSVDLPDGIAPLDPNLRGKVVGPSMRAMAPHQAGRDPTKGETK